MRKVTRTQFEEEDDDMVREFIFITDSIYTTVVISEVSKYELCQCWLSKIYKPLLVPSVYRM